MLYNVSAVVPRILRVQEVVNLRAIAILFVLAALIFTGSPALAWDLHPVELSEGFELAPYTHAATEAGGAGAGLVQVHDSTGRLVATARWDGVSRSRSSAADAGSGWAIPLMAWTGESWILLDLEALAVEPEDAAHLAGVELRLSAADDPEVARRYAYTLTLAGTADGSAWVDPATGTMAAVSSAAPRGESGPSPIRRYLVLVSDDSSVAFRPTEDGNRLEAVVTFGAPAGRTSSPGDARLMTITSILVDCWSHEPALALASALRSKVPGSDVRVFSTADKNAVAPGDTVTYTYYMFNAGTEPPHRLSMSLTAPAGTVLLPESVRSDGGTVTVRTSGGASGDSITWEATDDLLPGGLVSVSFSVIVP